MATIPKEYKNKELKHTKVHLTLNAYLIADTMTQEAYKLIFDYIDELEMKAGLK